MNNTTLNKQLIFSFSKYVRLKSVYSSLRFWLCIDFIIWVLKSYCSLEKSLFPQSLGAVLNRQSCFPGDSDSEQCACNAGDLGLIPGSGRSPGEGHGNPLRYSCLENPHGQRSLAGYSPWGHKESDTTERLSTHPSMCLSISEGAPKDTRTFKWCFVIFSVLYVYISLRLFSIIGYYKILNIVSCAK